MGALIGGGALLWALAAALLGVPAAAAVPAVLGTRSVAEPAMAAATIGPDIAASAPGAVHAHLVSSSPADGDTVVGPPERLRLVFSEPIEEAFSGIVLRAWDGRELALAPRRAAEDARVLEAELPEMSAGGYRVSWRIVSADGHPVAGSFAFYVAAADVDAPGAVSPSVPLPTAPPAGVEHAGHGSPAGTIGEPPVAAALVRGVSLGALMALAGLLAVLAWLTGGSYPRLDRVALALAAITPLVVAADFLVWLQHAAPAHQLTFDALETALATRSGLFGALRVGLACLALWAIGLAGRRSLAAILAMGALLLSAPTGHPAAIHPALTVPAKAVHLVAAAVWLGGLLLLLLSGRTDERFREDAFRVSSAALLAVLAIAATGVLQTALFLSSPADLVGSTYGLLALGKVTGLAVLVGFGAVNRYRILPRMRAGGGPVGLRRSVRGETLVMAALVLLAAFLAYVPPPVEAEPAVAGASSAAGRAAGTGHPALGAAAEAGRGATAGLEPERGAVGEREPGRPR